MGLETFVTAVRTTSPTGAEAPPAVGEATFASLDEARRFARLWRVRAPLDGRAHALAAVYEALAGEPAAARRLTQHAAMLARGESEILEICAFALTICGADLHAMSFRRSAATLRRRGC